MARKVRCPYCDEEFSLRGIKGHVRWVHPDKVDEFNDKFYPQMKDDTSYTPDSNPGPGSPPAPPKQDSTPPKPKSTPKPPPQETPEPDDQEPDDQESDGQDKPFLEKIFDALKNY